MSERIGESIFTRDIPEQGQLVEVRQRRYVVTDVTRSSLPLSPLAPDNGRPYHLVTLTSVEDDALGEEVQVIWELEPGARAYHAKALPAYRGNLFDPDRYPFVEGRPANTAWRDMPAQPLPINSRAVPHLLDTLRMRQVKVPGGGPAEARRLSFRALDIEQSGHVYEGLLDHTVVRAETPVLGLTGTRDRELEIPPLALEEVGETYHERRRQVMLAQQEGLTATYNRFHDPDETGEDIARLRELQVEMNQAVAAACGWDDPSTGSGQRLDLGHGFHETPQGLRFTISEAARREVLGRLLELNHQRYAEEVKAGLRGKKPKQNKHAKEPEHQPKLF